MDILRLITLALSVVIVLLSYSHGSVAGIVIGVLLLFLTAFAK